MSTYFVSKKFVVDYINYNSVGNNRSVETEVFRQDALSHGVADAIIETSIYKFRCRYPENFMNPERLTLPSKINPFLYCN